MARARGRLLTCCRSRARNLDRHFLSRIFLRERGLHVIGTDDRFRVDASDAVPGLRPALAAALSATSRGQLVSIQRRLAGE